MKQSELKAAIRHVDLLATVLPQAGYVTPSISERQRIAKSLSVVLTAARWYADVEPAQRILGKAIADEVSEQDLFGAPL